MAIGGHNHIALLLIILQDRLICLISCFVETVILLQQRVVSPPPTNYQYITQNSATI